MGRNSLNRKLSLEQWNKLGYRVLKGSKSKTRNQKGIAAFSEDQVVKRNPRNYRTRITWVSGDDPYDDNYDDWDFGGGEWGS